MLSLPLSLCLLHHHHPTDAALVIILADTDTATHTQVERNVKVHFVLALELLIYVV